MGDVRLRGREVYCRHAGMRTGKRGVKKRREIGMDNSERGPKGDSRAWGEMEVTEAK